MDSCSPTHKLIREKVVKLFLLSNNEDLSSMFAYLISNDGDCDIKDGKIFDFPFNFGGIDYVIRMKQFSHDNDLYVKNSIIVGIFDSLTEDSFGSIKQGIMNYEQQKIITYLPQEGNVLDISEVKQFSEEFEIPLIVLDDRDPQPLLCIIASQFPNIFVGHV